MCGASIGGRTVVDGEEKEEEEKVVKGATASMLLDRGLGNVLKGWTERLNEAPVSGFGGSGDVVTAEEEKDGDGLDSGEDSGIFEYEMVLVSGATFAWSSSKLLLVSPLVHGCVCVVVMAFRSAVEDVQDSKGISLNLLISSASGKTV